MIEDYYDFPMGSAFLSSRSITDADRDGGRKLARLRRGFSVMTPVPSRYFRPQSRGAVIQALPAAS